MSSAHEAPNSFFNDLLNDIEKNRLPLPTQPKIAIAIQDLNLHPNVTSTKLSEVIGKDPGLTARVIRIANSPLARGVVIINSLDVAISRLGIQFVTSMALGLAMEQLFVAKNKIVENKLREAWQHCGRVAAMSFVLAQTSKLFPAQEAALAGLLHEIGILPILVYAERNSDLLKDIPALDMLIQKHYTPLGEAILTSWQFPREIAALPQKLIDIYRNVEKPDLADIVLVAKIEMLQGTNHPLALIDKTEVPAYERLKLNPAENLQENENFKESLAIALQIFA
jgi:HD-like signal output (HDOD) protein